MACGRGISGHSARALVGAPRLGGVSPKQGALPPMAMLRINVETRLSARICVLTTYLNLSKHAKVHLGPYQVGDALPSVVGLCGTTVPPACQKSLCRKKKKRAGATATPMSRPSGTARHNRASLGEGACECGCRARPRGRMPGCGRSGPAGQRGTTSREGEYDESGLRGTLLQRACGLLHGLPVSHALGRLNLMPVRPQQPCTFGIQRGGHLGQNGQNCGFDGTKMCQREAAQARQRHIVGGWKTATRPPICECQDNDTPIHWPRCGSHHRRVHYRPNGQWHIGAVHGHSVGAPVVAVKLIAAVAERFTLRDESGS